MTSASARPGPAPETDGLLRYLAGHLAVGTIAAAAVAGALVASNAAGLAELAFADEQGAVALGLLCFGLWVTFGGLALGAGIMGIGRPHPNGTGGGRPAHGRWSAAFANFLIPDGRAIARPIRDPRRVGRPQPPARSVRPRSGSRSSR